MGRAGGLLMVPGAVLAGAATHALAHRRRRGGPAPAPRQILLTGVVVALSVGALLALAAGLTGVVGVDGQGVSVVAGWPLLFLLVGLLAAAGGVATGALLVRALRRRHDGVHPRRTLVVCAAVAAWLALTGYWLL